MIYCIFGQASSEIENCPVVKYPFSILESYELQIVYQKGILSERVCYTEKKMKNPLRKIQKSE